MSGSTTRVKRTAPKITTGTPDGVEQPLPVEARTPKLILRGKPGDQASDAVLLGKTNAPLSDASTGKRKLRMMAPGTATKATNTGAICAPGYLTSWARIESGGIELAREQGFDLVEEGDERILNPEAFRRVTLGGKVFLGRTDTILAITTEEEFVEAVRVGIDAYNRVMMGEGGALSATPIPVADLRKSGYLTAEEVEAQRQASDAQLGIVDEIDTE